MNNKVSLYNMYESNLHSSSEIVFCDGINRFTLKYNELHTYVCQFACFLKSLFISKSVVCCLMRPGLLLPAVILGILKTSSAFVFLDVHKPFESLLAFQKYLIIKELLIEECYLKTLESKLCCCWMKVNEISLKSTFIILQSSNCNNNECPNSNPCERNEMQSEIAYVVQTSGTTGEPKIIQVPQECIIPNILDFRSRFQVSADDVILQSTRITFDPSIIEIFLALLAGSTLVMIADHIRSIPKLLMDVITNNNITIFQATPSLILNFGENFLKNHLLHDNSTVRILAFGGEVCPSLNKIQKWKSDGNKTQIYNLYGLTEVSCWASCFKIDLHMRESLSVVPIGEPLLDTKLEIHNHDGKIADRGELFIGGKRFCIVNDEQWPASSDNFMRPTGDLVYKTFDGFICFEGRCDSIIKYKGHKISLYRVNKVIDSFPEVESYFVHFDSVTITLYLFIVWTSINVKCSEMECILVKNIRKSILKLPSVMVVSVPFIPLTKHGKGDIKKLLNLAKEKRLNVEKVQRENYEDVILKFWKRYTNQEIVLETDNFILNGGDSISAVQFASDLEWNFQLSMPLIIEKILNESFLDVKNFMKFCLRDSHQEISYDEKMLSSVEVLDQPAIKKKRYLNSQCFQVSCKQGYFERCLHYDLRCCSITNSSKNLDILNLNINLMFKSDLKKCIDATPCILCLPQSNQYFVFIGSHFGQFSCIDLNKREEKWHILLPDRIESSACISACGNFVLFGCYDHHLYCISIENGSILWKLETDAEIKSSPSVSCCNIVFSGSHDKHLYAVNVENGSLLWKKQIASGSIFSSPAVIEELQAVCIATLDGVLALLRMESGDILWKHHSAKPLFSSPLIASNLIFIGSTNSSCFAFDFNGKVKFIFSTDGPVFSSATFNKDSKHVVFGCHDSYVYCVTLDGSLIWKISCDSAVYATPSIFKWKNHDYVCVASSKGSLYIIQCNNGKVIYSWNCPGEVFSSPIVLNDFLVIGCRDNNVYFFNLKFFN